MTPSKGPASWTNPGLTVKASALPMAAWLIATSGRVQLRKYRKHPRGPKKPPVKRTHDPRRPHVSVARLLALRQQAKEAATP